MERGEREREREREREKKRDFIYIYIYIYAIKSCYFIDTRLNLVSHARTQERARHS